MLLFLPICQLPKIPSRDGAHGVNTLITVTLQQAPINNSFQMDAGLVESCDAETLSQAQAEGCGRKPILTDINTLQLLLS